MRHTVGGQGARDKDVEGRFWEYLNNAREPFWWPKSVFRGLKKTEALDLGQIWGCRELMSD